MKRVTADQISDIAQYEKKREAFRKEIIALKKRRRVAVGPQVTFVFENPETVLFQVQEMMRAERIVAEEAIQHELDTYNALLVETEGLGATMLIELTDSSRIREAMDKFLGVNDGNITYLQVGNERIPGQFALGQSNETRVSAVQYVKFPLSQDQRGAFADPSTRIELVIDHPAYRHRTSIEGEQRLELIGDLGVQ
jgi:Protein of unknown function (DUF3501)